MSTRAFAKSLQRIKSLTPRPAEWTNRLGPACVLGMEGLHPNSGKPLLDYLWKDSPNCDHYAEIKVVDGLTPVELPPETVLHMPAVNAGVLQSLSPQGDAETIGTDAEWYLAATEATSSLLEKGYTPINVGGDGSFTLPMLECYKRVFPDDEVILMHFSAHSLMSDVRAPVRVVQEKRLTKGVISVGNRCVGREDRRLRREFKMHYLDLSALYSKGLFCMRDIRNDYPIFLSVDLGVLDPSCAPGVLRPVAGGFSVRDFLHVLYSVRGPKIAGVDVHGYRSECDIRRPDGAGLTEMAASLILKELVLKVYAMSTLTEAEGVGHMQMMQRQGQVAADNPYPDV